MDTHTRECVGTILFFILNHFFVAVAIDAPKSFYRILPVMTAFQKRPFRLTSL